LSEKESVAGTESENGDEELRAEQNMPPLRGPGGAPRMLPNSFGTVTGLPHDNVIHQDVLFEIPPFISKEKDVAPSVPIPSTAHWLTSQLEEVLLRWLGVHLATKSQQGVLLLMLFYTGDSRNLFLKEGNISKKQHNRWSSKQTKNWWVRQHIVEHHFILLFWKMLAIRSILGLYTIMVMTMSMMTRTRPPEIPLSSQIDLLVHLVIVTTTPHTSVLVEVVDDAEVGAAEVLRRAVDMVVLHYKRKIILAQR
jgi:hypothetical protein